MRAPIRELPHLLIGPRFFAQRAVDCWNLFQPSLKRLVAQSLGLHGSRCHGSARDKSRSLRLEQVPAVHGASRYIAARHSFAALAIHFNL